ncbi:MAG: ATP-binding protein [Christensenellaceae bacterium]|jgi:DNA replication protein DnaC|nr:ATP-binding protein [Christensenellaceae bacterium]
MKPSPLLLEEYHTARAQALRACEARKRAAYAALPRLQELAAARKQATYALGQALLHAENGQAARHQYAMNMAALMKEEQALLAEAGIDKALLQPVFRCPLCEDTGYVGLQPRTLCGCLRQRMLEEEFAKSGIGDADRFDTFRTDIFADEKQKKATCKAKQACEAYAGGFPNNSPAGLLLLGQSGLGKTFLLHAVARRVLERGYGVVFLTAYDLIATILERIQTRAPLPDMIAPDLLVIDDLGTEPMLNNITREQLCALLDGRQRANKPTAMASNLSPETIVEEYGERFAFRLLSPRNTLTIRLFGKNLRA